MVCCEMKQICAANVQDAVEIECCVSTKIVKAPPLCEETVCYTHRTHAVSTMPPLSSS